MTPSLCISRGAFPARWSAASTTLAPTRAQHDEDQQHDGLPQYETTSTSGRRTLDSDIHYVTRIGRQQHDADWHDVQREINSSSSSRTTGTIKLFQLDQHTRRQQFALLMKVSGPSSAPRCSVWESRNITPNSPSTTDRSANESCAAQ